MGQQITFDEAVAAWRRLTDPTVPENGWDGSMLETCEAIILAYPVGSHGQAAAICAVLANGTYGRDAAALDRLSTWLDAMSRRSAGSAGPSVGSDDAETSAA